MYPVVVARATRAGTAFWSWQALKLYCLEPYTTKVLSPKFFKRYPKPYTLNPNRLRPGFV